MIRNLTAVLIAAMLSFTALAQDAPRTIEMKVDGLVCAFCAQGISKKLGKMDATAEVFVSLENGLVAVVPKPGQDLADPVLREALTEAGYTVQAIERKAETLDALRARLKVKP
ncbi:copper chaperone [Solimonas sp. K1W22B-7]|uniref:heavy-metal-associated domain-containing protein n=1 Tax=Solimonas sp. K1W22B-7 TaxID=2303331 RepID=UPI000E32F52E|nr:heavy-metal-associated domain-containing protein [Solimonas sp. K1W22B-7]AXQ30206.1 copper chaperone [Solimonas sp. K1W22B-7]